MQGASLAQRQLGKAIPIQIQANAILGMNTIELQQFIDTEAMENPALAVEDGARCPVCGFIAPEKTCQVCGAAIKDSRADTLEVRASERDYLERAFTAANPDDAFDPFRTVATGSGLRDHLMQQARMCLGGRQLRIAEFLIDSLDDDGYFRESLYETAEMFAAAVPEIESVLEVVQGFDPPGIAARDLRECLLIQLHAAAEFTDPANLAARIISEHWDDFSRMKLKAIAARLDVGTDDVRDAYEFVRDRLTPRPASLYHGHCDALSPRETAAIVPDVVVRGVGESFAAEVVDKHSSVLMVDETYQSAYESMRGDGGYLTAEDCKHIKEHVERVKCILEAIELRKKTLARVATYLAQYQRDFLAHGASRLRPLRQKDVAAKLGVHESTICRAVAGKFCRLPSGEVVSFEMFFDSALPIREMISQLIARSTQPLSDGEIAKRLAEEGVSIARRTVAKYRDQLRLLPCQLRAA